MVPRQGQLNRFKYMPQNPIMLPPGAVTSKLVDQQVPIPPNIANQLDPSVQKELMKDMYDNYVFPQVLERQQYEPMWDTLLDMYRIKMKESKLKLGPDDQEKRDRLIEIQSRAGGDGALAQVSDSLVFDAVDRLKNLNHFISWKDGAPIQYNISPSFSSSRENTFYHPLADKIKSANGLLQWNINNQDVYRKHLIVSQHHYLYGCSFVASELELESKVFQRRSATGIQNVQELYRAGVTFEPISIRKLWLNYRMSAYAMDDQPCPFIFEEMPRFGIMANEYNAQTNPFGYVNLDKLPTPQYLFQQEEMNSFREAVYSRLNCNVGTELLKPEYSVEGRWTFYPMLQLDPVTLEYKRRANGDLIPFKRFIVQWFGSNLRNGQIYPIRIQQNFYPMDRLPIYSSQHIPDQDSGAYSPSLGELLVGHYEQVTTCMNQWLDNKNLINNPPSWHVTGSPSQTEDCNRPGVRLNVLGPNDFGWRTVPDATQSTVSMLEYLRDKAKTTSKATEAILGQAMGSRTTATEAQNVFQAAMSGVTTDINLFNYDIMGGYANRVWEISGLFFDTDLIKAITGMYGEPLTMEDLNTRVELKWDIGSTYIESITKQQHLRYALESAVNSPVLRQDVLWRLMFKELKMPQLEQAIVDGGFAEQVQRATEQAIETYQGRPIMVDPSQDHQAALEVKTRFIQDLESRWNTEFGGLPDVSGKMTRVQNLATQCQLHQQFLMLQMQQQMAMQKAQMNEQMQAEQGKRDSRSGPISQKGGDVAQQNGRRLN